jgi:hypothetical protein
MIQSKHITLMSSCICDSKTCNVSESFGIVFK